MKNINILCKIKSHFPKGYLFFVIFLFSKMYGSLIISIVTKYKSHQNSLYFSFLNLLTFYSKHLLELSYFHLLYELLCFLIYIYAIIIVIFCFILLINKPEENLKLIHLSSKSKHSKKRYIPLVSVLFTLAVLLSQYLIEILSFPICLIIIKSTNESNLNTQFVDLYIKFILSLRINYYFYLVMNIIVILLINYFVVFYVKLYNNVHLSKKKIIAFTPHNLSIIILAFTQNMQIVHYYIYLFNENTSCILNLNYVALLYYFFAIGIFIYQVTYLDFGNLSILFAYLFCFFGSIISIIYNTYKNSNLSLAQIYFQFCFQFILTGLCICLLYLLKIHMFQTRLPSFLFRYNRKGNYNYIFEFLIFIKECFSEIDKTFYLFSFILSHQESCLNSECDCSSINITELRAIIRGSKIDKKFIKSRNNKLLIDIILIIENILLNYIHTLSQTKELWKHYYLIIFHCNYVYYFKRNYIYSIYILDEYLSQLRCMPFEYKVLLYSFKKKVVKSFNKKTKRAVYDGSYIVKCNKFALYYNHLLIIRKQINEGSKFYSKILNLKKLLCECKEKSSDGNSSYHSQTSSYIKLLFANCKEFAIRVKDIEQSLQRYYSENNNNEPIYNQEICYLITNFFVITHKVIPEIIHETFIPTDSYYQLNNTISYYSEVQFVHPMILSIKSVSNSVNSENYKEANGLYIEYVSQQMLDILGYKKSEIIEQEIKKLIPQFLAEKQTNILQSHFFIHKKVEMELLMLLITKEKYFKRAFGVIGSFPTLMNHVLLICNIDIFDNELSSNRFRFVLDVYGKIITFTENFAKKYWLTYQMVNKLDIKFSSLFGINMEKLCSEFKKTISQIKESDSLLIEKYVNILSSCKLGDFLAVHRHKTPYDLIKEEEDKTFITAKKKAEIKKYVYCIRKEVEEKEVEANWLNRLKSLESSLASDNFQESSLNFEIMLRHIGNIPYFIAVVTDENVLDHAQMRSILICKRREMISSEKNVLKYNFNIAREFNTSRKVSVYKNESNHVETAKNSSFSHETMDDILPNQSSTIISLKEIKLIHSLKSNKRKRKNTTFKFFQKEAQFLLIKAQGIIISLYDKLLFVFLEILSCSIIFVHIMQTILQQNSFKCLEEISTLSFNAILFKEMYYDTVNYYTSLCFRLDGLEFENEVNIQFSNDKLIEQLVSSSSSLLSYSNLLIKTITTIDIETERQELFNILFGIIPFKRLKRNWSIEEYYSSVEHEISMIRYHMGMLRKGYSDICRLTTIFLNNPLIETEKLRLHITKNPSKEKDETTIEEIIFFSFLLNSLKNVSKKIDLFIVKSTSYQRLMRSSTSSSINQFNIVSICLMLAEIIAFTLLLLSFKKKLIELLYIFITKTPRITYQEIKIAAFIKVICSFEEETCKSFEDRIYTSGETDKEIVHSNPQTKGNTNTTKLTSKPKKSVIINTDKKRTEEEEGIFNNHSMNTSIQLITFNFAIVAIFLIIYLVIAFTSLVNYLNILENLKLTHEIGKIYLSSIPRFNQILLYYKQSILVNNPNFDTIELLDYELYDYCQSEYFTPDSKIEDDSRYHLMGKSTMAFLFKTFHEEIEIMKKYNQNSELKVLPLSRNFQNALTCKELVISFHSFLKNEDSEKIKQVIDLIDYNCNEIANGLMKKGGLQINLENSVNSLFNIYLEFIQEKDQTDLIKYFKNEDYILALFEMQNVFTYMFFTISNFISQDTVNFFNDFHRMSLIFVILSTIVMCIIIFTFIFILYPKLLSFFNNFRDIVLRMEISLLDDKHFTV